ncbi:MAG: hypothetical protein KI788_00555 [Mameliella sp.]|nr:hypothetical protein [Mameliella sp.]
MSDEAEKEPTKKYRQLTPLEFERAKTMWEMGSATLADLAEEFDVHPSSMYERLQRAGAKRGSRVHEAMAKMEEDTQEEVAKAARRVQETKESHYRYAEAIAQMTMNTLVEARKNKRTIASTDPDLTALNKAAKTLEITRKERYTLLGLDSEGTEPGEEDEILITEMSSDQIEEIQNASRGVVGNDDGVDGLLSEIDIVEETDEGDQE